MQNRTDKKDFSEAYSHSDTITDSWINIYTFRQNVQKLDLFRTFHLERIESTVNIPLPSPELAAELRLVDFSCYPVHPRSLRTTYSKGLLVLSSTWDKTSTYKLQSSIQQQKQGLFRRSQVRPKHGKCYNLQKTQRRKTGLRKLNKDMKT